MDGRPGNVLFPWVWDSESVEDTQKEYRSLLALSAKQVWIGLSDEDDETNYAWVVDGSAPAFTDYVFGELNLGEREFSEH